MNTPLGCPSCGAPQQEIVKGINTCPYCNTTYHFLETSATVNSFNKWARDYLERQWSGNQEPNDSTTDKRPEETRDLFKDPTYIGKWVFFGLSMIILLSVILNLPLWIPIWISFLSFAITTKIKQ